MEFLVRLEDKVNTQVFCLNPVHKDNHMERVVFDDPSFTTPCPDCKSGDWLYRKNNAISKKGHFITYKPDGWTWGSNERKHYGIMRINCAEEEAVKWCKSVGVNDPKNPTSMIAYRPRKYALDLEKVLTAKELEAWNDQDVYSEIKILEVDDLTNIGVTT